MTAKSVRIETKIPTMPSPIDTTLRSATISVLVENEAGVLARVIGLFSGRGYNIDSLTVAPVDADGRRSRINVVTSGTEMVIEQIKAQLDRLVPVHRVADLTREGPHVAREMRAFLRKIGNLVHRHQPVELRLDLLDHHFGARGDDVDAAAAALVLNRGHRQALDVVAAAGEQADDARQHAGLVFDENRDRRAAQSGIG